MPNTISVVLSGVGGQGVLLSSNLIASVALKAGLDVKQAEVHGMSQRGGSVISHVRFGEKVYSPTIEKGTAQVLCSFEPLEAVRYAEYVRPNGLVIFNTDRIQPLTTIFGDIKYPENPKKLIEKHVKNVHEIEALKVAKEFNMPKALNIALLGALSRALPFTENQWNEAIAELVKPKFVEINKKVFARGRELFSEAPVELTL